MLAPPEPEPEPAFPEIPPGLSMIAECQAGERTRSPTSGRPTTPSSCSTTSCPGTNTKTGLQSTARSALERFNTFPVRLVTWKIKAEEPWAFNEWLYDSHQDYVRRAILGGDGFADNPKILTSPDEHKAFIDRYSAACKSR